MEGYIGQIILFAGTFAPQNWEYCNGQLIQIAQNSALFSILGTTYGGDGQRTFALPDLRSRVPVGTGQAPGFSNYVLGQQSGVERTSIQGSVQVALTAANLPAHTHGIVGDVKVVVADQAANTIGGAGNALAKTSVAPTTGTTDIQTYVGGRTISFTEGNKLSGVSHNLATTATGTGTPFNAPFVGNVPIVQPYTALNYIICMMGIYPSRP